MKANRIFIAILGVVFLGGLIYFFSNIVAYVLIAWVLSFVGQPIMLFLLDKVKMRRLKFGQQLAAGLTLIVFFIVAFILVLLFVPLIVEQARNLSEVDYNQILIALEDPINQLNRRLTEIGLLDPEGSVETSFDTLLDRWFDPSRLGEFFGSFIGIAGNLILAIFSVCFITFFFLQDTGIFVNIISALVPNKYEENTRHSIDSISRLLTRYFGGIVLQITIITIFVSVFLSILGVKNALLIGFFAALINVIPYLGPLIGAAFAVLITISSNLDIDFYTQMLPLIIKVIAVFVSMQLLDNFVLQPFIFSNSVSAHPLEIFIVILMGAQVGGIGGMILAIPTYTVFRVVAKVFLSEFKVVKRLTGGMTQV